MTRVRLRKNKTKTKNRNLRKNNRNSLRRNKSIKSKKTKQRTRKKRNIHIGSSKEEEAAVKKFLKGKGYVKKVKKKPSFGFCQNCYEERKHVYQLKVLKPFCLYSWYIGEMISYNIDEALNICVHCLFTLKNSLLETPPSSESGDKYRAKPGKNGDLHNNYFSYREDGKQACCSCEDNCIGYDEQFFSEEKKTCLENITINIGDKSEKGHVIKYPYIFKESEYPRGLPWARALDDLDEYKDKKKTFIFDTDPKRTNFYVELINEEAYKKLMEENRERRFERSGRDIDNSNFSISLNGKPLEELKEMLTNKGIDYEKKNLIKQRILEIKKAEYETKMIERERSRESGL